MTAMLLAHSDLFRAGIARSGAYNRTLTPFGFQSERRTLWEAPQSYLALSPFLRADKIKAPLTWVNSADDFINPPELGLAQQQVKQMPRARFILIPYSTETKGHGTHTWAKFWKDDLIKLMAEKP